MKRHPKQFKDLNSISPKRNIGYIEGKAKPGCKAQLDSAKELQALLRDYTYHVIGLGNSFRRIASLYGKFDGTYWRTYKGMASKELQSLADQLNSMSPYDIDAILKIENALEALAEKLIKGNGK